MPFKTSGNFGWYFIETFSNLIFPTFGNYSSNSDIKFLWGSTSAKFKHLCVEANEIFTSTNLLNKYLKEVFKITQYCKTYPTKD